MTCKLQWVLLSTLMLFAGMLSARPAEAATGYCGPSFTFTPCNCTVNGNGLPYVCIPDTARAANAACYCYSQGYGCTTASCPGNPYCQYPIACTMWWGTDTCPGTCPNVD